MPQKRKINLYTQAVLLRKKGNSYKEICSLLGLSKSTLSDWLSHKKWSSSIKEQLTFLNRERSSNFLKAINRVKHHETIQKYEEYKRQAREEYEAFIKDRLFVTGISLYWGEGNKTNSGRVSVVNSDIDVLRTTINFYRKCLKVPEEKLRGEIFIYQDIDQEVALKYWSKNLRLNESNFIKTQVLPSRSKLTQRKVRYGMCCVYFSSVEKSVKIGEWIRILAKDTRM